MRRKRTRLLDGIEPLSDQEIGRYYDQVSGTLIKRFLVTLQLRDSELFRRENELAMKDAEIRALREEKARLSRRSSRSEGRD